MFEPEAESEQEREPEAAPTPSAPARGSLGTVLLAIVLLALGAGYGLHERSVAKQFAAQNDLVSSALKQTQGQVDTLTARLNAAAAAQQAQQSQEAAAVSPSGHRVKHTAVRRRPKDDPRWKQVQDQLAQHQQEIESTQQDLASAKTDLSGSIARTHDELVVLQKKGERNYYEFDIDKSKQFSREGSVGLKLRKANTKHQYADMEMLVDDIALSKKHVNLYEPVMFYPQDSQQPVELVINRITKNHIHGYVSTPKYKPSELAASASADTQSSVPQKTDSPNKVSSQAPHSAATSNPPTLHPRNQ